MAVSHIRYASAVVTAGLTTAALLACPSVSPGTTTAAATSSPSSTSSPPSSSPTAASSPPPSALPTSVAAETSEVTPEPRVAQAPGPAPTTAEAAAPPSAPTVKPVAVVVPVSGLTRSGIPETALDAYREAAAGAPNSCDIDWSLLAAIGRVESNHGRFGGAKLHTDGESAPPILGPVLDGTGTALITDTDDGALDGDSVHDRAVGPMQFIPSTWRLYGRDGNDDGREDPFNIYDAAAAAAAYLCRAGRDLSTVAGQSTAVFAYNHSAGYVATVLNLAATYAGTPPPVIPSTPAEEAPAPPVNPAPPPAVEQEAVAAASSAPSDPTPSPTETTAPPSTAAAAVIPASPPTDPTATTPPATTTDSTTPPATPTDTTTPPADTETPPPADSTTSPADTPPPPAETTTASATPTDTTPLPAT